MSIISSGLKWIFVVSMTFPGVAVAQTAAPKLVRLGGGYDLMVKGRSLVRMDASRHQALKIELPTSLARTIYKSSSVEFPSGYSKIIDGGEYALIVVNQASSNNPMGYCGAGEEGALYVLKFNGLHADSHLSLLVRSCLKNIVLETDTGTKSPYSSIVWNDAPSGIKISWESYGDAGFTSHIYRYENGKFVEPTH